MIIYNNNFHGNIPQWIAECFYRDSFIVSENKFESMPYYWIGGKTFIFDHNELTMNNSQIYFKVVSVRSANKI